MASWFRVRQKQGTPSVPQPGTMGSLMSNPSPQMQQLVERCIVGGSPSGYTLEFRGYAPPHAEYPDDDDVGDDLDNMGGSPMPTLDEFVTPAPYVQTPSPVQTMHNFNWRTLSSSAPSSVAAAAQPTMPVIQ